MPYEITDECMLCGACISGCEVNAIHEEDEKCVIDSTVCIECGTCEMNCPFNAILYTMSSVSTGGFSPHNNSLEWFDSKIICFEDKRNNFAQNDFA